MTAPASKLLQPITVGPLELKNRIMFPPLTTGYEERDGSIGERSLAFYERLARGGVSYIVIGDVAPVMTASPTPKLATDAQIPTFKALADAVHKHGAKVALQLFHPEYDVPGVGRFCATLINAGIPTIFLDAGELGYTGCELQDAINSDGPALARFEAIRAHGAIRMGLIKDLSEAATRQHTPKIGFVAPAQSYIASSGKVIAAEDIDLVVRALSMGRLHHAMMGTAAVAIGTAAAIPGTLVNLAAGDGHPAEIMDMSFAVQAKCAEYMVKNPPAQKINAVPEAIDAEVARRKLE